MSQLAKLMLWTFCTVAHGIAFHIQLRFRCWNIICPENNAAEERKYDRNTAVTATEENNANHCGAWSGTCETTCRGSSCAREPPAGCPLTAGRPAVLGTTSRALNNQSSGTSHLSAPMRRLPLQNEGANFCKYPAVGVHFGTLRLS